ncbi:IS21-like element helper ATPase IstB [Rhodocytophaga aerolata]
MQTPTHQQISSLCKELRLPAIRQQFSEIAQQAATQRLDYEQFLLGLLKEEYEMRVENRRKVALRQAGFPQLKYLPDLSLEDLPAEAAEKLSLLERLDFMRNGQNLILAGNPGTGKTHMAIGLGVKACLQGYKVLFTSVSRLLTQIRESRSQKALRMIENRFEKYDLVICDEFGYISFDKEGAELLFTHLSLRAGHKSTIITTNLSFDRWKEIFGDPVLTAAMVDRLTHRAYIINMNGKSYRMKETKQWLQKESAKKE